jgi:two-component system NtrC family sensor kinase
VTASTRDELLRSIRDSAARVEAVTHRLRRFVTLEEAELKSADLNELLSDVAVLHDDEIRERHIQLAFDLEKHLPKLTCRPQLLSSAFSTFLSNAIHAVNGDGRIEIQTRGLGSEVEVTIRDNGRGMSPEQADTIFDPTFRVSGSRVSSGNWGLFNSRQIVYEHGGDIRVDTAEGRGTTVLITLPITASEA